MNTNRNASALLGLMAGAALCADTFSRAAASPKSDGWTWPDLREHTLAPPKIVAKSEKFFPSKPAAPRNVRNRRDMASASRKRNRK